MDDPRSFSELVTLAVRRRCDAQLFVHTVRAHLPANAEDRAGIRQRLAALLTHHPQLRESFLDDDPTIRTVVVSLVRELTADVPRFDAVAEGLTRTRLLWSYLASTPSGVHALDAAFPFERDRHFDAASAAR